MYSLPGYITHYKQDNATYVVSNLYKNVVKLTDHNIQKEFDEIVSCSKCDKLNTPLTKFLHDQEMLLNEEELEQVLQKVRKLLDSTLMLTIMPTESCNFCCPYCYENHATSHMPRTILDWIKKYLIEETPKYKNLNIGWFGGEPTLCKNVILEVCELIQNLRSTHDFRFFSSMTTNGYLLNAEMFCEFYRLGITNYHITLDGWNHNQTRPHVSGHETLQTIIRNLLAISTLPKEEFAFKITLRHNILAGDEDYSWYDYLYRLFGQDNRFDIYIHPVDDWGGDSVQHLNLLVQKSKEKIIASHIAYLNKIGMQCSNNQREHQLFKHVCYACYPHGMIFRPNGKIEKCTLCLDHPKNQLGYIDPNKGVIINQAVSQQWSYSELKSECRSCPDILQCMNLRCARNRIIENKITSHCNLSKLNLY